MATINEFAVVLDAEIDPAEAERIAAEIEFLVNGIMDSDGCGIMAHVEIR